MKKINIWKLNGIAAACFMFSTPAHALCDACVVKAVIDATVAITGSVSAVTSAVTYAGTNIVRAISMGAQMQSDATTQGARNAADTKITVDKEFEAQRQVPRFQVADACAVTASSKGVHDASRSSGAPVGRGGGGGRTARTGSNESLNKVLDISQNNVPAPTLEVQAGLATKGGCEGFASAGAGAVRAASCTAAGFTASASNGHPDADIRAETLFDGPQKATSAANFRRRLTVNAGTAEQTAVEAYLRNLNTPFAARQLTKSELATDAGRKYLAFSDAYEARMSAAEKPSRALAANMLANTTLIPVVEQLTASDVSGTFVKAYLAANAPTWKTKGISMAELVNLEGERRYLNKDWHVQMAALPPEAHVKEQTTMMSYQIYLLSRIDERLGQLAALSGQGMASQVRTEMTPQLNALHQSATR